MHSNKIEAFADDCTRLRQCLDNKFITKTSMMLQEIPVNIRQKFPNSRTFSFACVKINGYNTVVVYKKIVPIAIIAEWGTQITALAAYDCWSMRSVNKACNILSELERFLDVPRYVFPV